MFNPEIHRERYRIVNERFSGYGRVLTVVKESLDKVYYHYSDDKKVKNISKQIFMIMYKVKI